MSDVLSESSAWFLAIEDFLISVLIGITSLTSTLKYMTSKMFTCIIHFVSSLETYNTLVIFSIRDFIRHLSMIECLRLLLF